MTSRLRRIALATLLAWLAPACWIVLGIDDRPVGEPSVAPDAGDAIVDVPVDVAVDAVLDVANDTTVDAGCRFVADAASYVFTDVADASDGAAAIAHAGSIGLVDPCGDASFCPELTMRRRDAVRWAVRAAAGSSFTYACDAVFVDVSPADPDFPYVQKAAMLGITGGCGNGKFCPDDNADRFQLSVFAVQAALLSDASILDAQSFDDVPRDASTWPWAQRASSYGLVGPCSGPDAGTDSGLPLFCPSGPASRRAGGIAYDRVSAYRDQ